MIGSDPQAALAHAVRAARARAHLSRRAVAEAMGYQNLAKGCAKLAAWERGDDIPRGDQPARLLHALPESAEALRGAITEEARARRAAEDQAAATAQGDRAALDAEATLVAGHAEALDRALQAPQGAWIRGARLSCARLGLAYLGGRALRLGELVSLWSQGHLLAPCPCHGAPMRVFSVSGTPLSGAHRLRGVCAVSGAATSGQRDPARHGTLLGFLGPALTPAMGAELEGPPLDAVLGALGLHPPAITLRHPDGAALGRWEPDTDTLRGAASEVLAVLPWAPGARRYEAQRGPERAGGAPVLGSIQPLRLGAWQGEHLVVSPAPDQGWRAVAGHLEDPEGCPRVRWSRPVPPRLVEWLAGHLSGASPRPEPGAPPSG